MYNQLLIDIMDQILKQQGPTSFKALFSKALSGLRMSHISKRSLQTKSSILLIVTVILSGFATYAALAEMPPFGDNPNLVIWLLNFDLIILLLLAGTIARRIVGIWSGRKRGLAGSHLHVRLVIIFSVLVAIPTIVMTVFSALFFHFGIQAWFSQRVQTAINESQAVAQSYLEEHKQVIRADTLAMANDLDRQAELLAINEERLTKAINTQSYLRNLSEAIIIDSNGRILGRSSLAFALEYERPSFYELERAENGDVVLITTSEQDRVRALVKLKNFANAYLFVGRMVDPEVISHLNSAKQATQDYKQLQTQYAGVQITSTMIFVSVGLLLLLAAIWAGLILARQIIIPISDLVNAADQIRSGDFKSKVSESKSFEEFAYLARSFNRMTEQLEAQRAEILEAKNKVDQRRRFIETVLSGVSSGVIGVDNDGLINLANVSASKILDKDRSALIDHYILDVIPELNDILQEFTENPKKTIQGETHVHSDKHGNRLYLFKISIETLEENKAGLIITFDDITDIHAAQKNAAWSDVARRIAHEIKNPLTPIQLSAERLKRKYLNSIDSDKDKQTFEQCTDTIIKHVEDIGHMVNEFSSYARMPEPNLNAKEITKTIQDSITLMRQAHTDIKISFIDFSNDNDIAHDRGQIRQLFANLFQNAFDAITACDDESTKEGHISVLIDQRDTHTLFIAVSDNGSGFPKDQDIANLTDPYVTHKEKGTGLGLAIARKIIEDHNGQLHLGTPNWLNANKHWKNLGGATLAMTFPMIGVDTEPNAT